MQNAQEIGHGYENKNKEVKRVEGDKLTWVFYAPNVHDFAWAADPDFVHDIIKGPENVDLHFLYKTHSENWQKLQQHSVDLMAFFNENIGRYPWKQYSIIQGGDGGMEYAMCTLITGGERYGSLFGTTAHEMAHAWFQHVLANNEAKHPWMDEGFASYIDALAENAVLKKNLILECRTNTGSGKEFQICEEALRPSHNHKAQLAVLRSVPDKKQTTIYSASGKKIKTVVIPLKENTPFFNEMQAG